MTEAFAKTKRRAAVGLLIGCAAVVFGGCDPEPAAPAAAPSLQSLPTSAAPLPSGAVSVVDLNDVAGPKPVAPATVFGAAKNEWTDFCLQLGPAPGGTGGVLRIGALRSDAAGATIEAGSFTAYQVLPMPVDAGRAGFIRHTGLPAASKKMPRALLPLPMTDGVIDLAALRDPGDPFNPAARPPAGGSSEPVLIWVDVHVPVEAKPGEYTARCAVAADAKAAANAVAGASVRMRVDDFVLPDERHLTMVSRLDWESLERLYPDRFEAITPRLVNRTAERYTNVVRTLDGLVGLAERNRAEVVVPRLQPTAKWPAAAPPTVDWSDFDSLVGPWMSGEAFADKTPLGYWPAPPVDHLESYDPTSQREYRAEVASHFSQQNWLERSAVFLDAGGARADAAGQLQLSARAAEVLRAHPLLRVNVPLEDEQLRWNSKQAATLLDPADSGRLVTASPGIVFAAPADNFPAGTARPRHWLRTDLPGLVPYSGAGGDERDVRLWAWLAYLRQADLILFGDPLPSQSNPAEQADPSQLTWFYPGSWFGVDAPVPSVQLKWVRRAQQDYEYLRLANQRGMGLNALLMARLMTKQVQLQPGQTPDPTYALLTGTADQKVWDEAQALLARTILLRPPGQAPDEAAERALDHDSLRWQQPKERPFVIPRSTGWQWDDAANAKGGGGGGPWASVRLGVDVYNAGDSRPDRNLLEWTAAGPGWQFSPRPTPVGALPTYWVQRFGVDAKIDLGKVTAEVADPVAVTFVDGYTRTPYATRAVIPVAPCDRREGGLTIDGRLGDWAAADACHDGPLTKMLDRPSLQRFELASAATPTQIFSGWGEENFYVAFKVSGVASRDVHFTTNFADYQFRRAWGDDLCELLVQPVYDDNTVGAVTHLILKEGSSWTERKLPDSRAGIGPWVPVEGAAVRYAAHVDEGNWWGEAAIPWKVIADPDKKRPRLLRFNFAQHKATTGETASWAGPIDFGRDDALMGLLFLRDDTGPGM